MVGNALTHQRIQIVVQQDIPVKRRPRVEHAQPVSEAGQNVEVEVVGRNPRHPAEEGEGLKEVVREPEVDEHGGERPQEELVARHPEDHLERSLDGARSTRVVIVQRRVEGNGHKRRRPHTVGWIHDESSCQARQAVTNKVGGQGDEDLVSKAAGVLLVKVLWEHLRPHDILRIRQTLSRIGHDSNQHMLLLVKRPRVEAVAVAKEFELVVGYQLFPRLAYRIGEELHNIGLDADSRLADAEELIHESEEEREEEADGPCPHGRARSVGVILVIDHGAHLSVWAVVGDEGGLDLHLLNQILVLLRVIEDVLIFLSLLEGVCLR